MVIAEAGVNHNGSLTTALQMVDVAADAGADAVKFQTANPEELARADAPKARYQEARTDSDRSQLEMLRGLMFRSNREDAYRELRERASKRGISLLSTPFDIESLHFLIQDVGISSIKIGSGDLTYAPLLLAAARSGRNMILSTGMARLEEIEAALGVLAYGYLGSEQPPCIDTFRWAFSDRAAQGLLRQRVTLLHCVTAYPAPAGQTNLKAMTTLREQFGLNVGFSDHALGNAMSIAAAALGAVVIEKHFTLDRSMPGPDHAASLEPDELAQLVSDIRLVESAMGTGAKEPQACERENMAMARRSLVARVPIRRGELLTEENVAVKRPSGGLSPLLYWQMLGTSAVRDFAADEAIEPRTSLLT